MTSSQPSEPKARTDKSLRYARVVPDVAGIEGEFDYKIPAKFDALVEVGTIVRVNFHNRRIRAWVIDADSTPPPGKRLLDIEHVTGAGPSQELIDLAGWAAWRWAGKRSFFLQTASPPRVVANFVHPPVRTVNFARKGTDTERQRAKFADSSTNIAREPGDSQGLRAMFVNQIVRVPPAQSPLAEVLAAGDEGTVLLVTPTQRSADGWTQRLRAEGKRVAQYPDQWRQAAEGNIDYVVGTRAAAWAPMPQFDAAVVIDAHDDGLRSEASPTWSAVDVVTERARRTGASCRLITPVPRVEQLVGRELISVERAAERNGWAPLVVIDQRDSDPRSGLYSKPIVELLRSDKKVVCILNRKGRSQLLICNACGEVAHCPECEGAQSQADDDLVCSRCKTHQPTLCQNCGSTKFKQLRIGVQKAREELESLANRPVADVSSETEGLPDAPVIIGTEAVLYRVQHCDAVVFLDFDQELSNPRYRASEDALVLLARASRIVGGHNRKGTVIVQTRQPDNDVIAAGVHGDPARFTEGEIKRRAEMNWPPNSALALTSGTAAEEYTNGIESDTLPMDAKTILIQAKDHQALCDALQKQVRPKHGSLRVEVDPVRV